MVNILDLSTDAEQQISTPDHMFYTYYGEKYFVYAYRGAQILKKT
jgi:hypothetical protein